MRGLLPLALFCLAAVSFGQEGEAGHLHGPDGRHIVAPQEAGGNQSFILSHHDMRIEGPDGKVVLGAKVDSTIHRKGDPQDVIHTEQNVYEPENEVYGSHLTYTEPGEYVLSQAVTMPDGKEISVEFPIYVPRDAEEPVHHHEGVSPSLVIGGIAGTILLMTLGFWLGKRSARAGGAAMLVFCGMVGVGLVTTATAQEDEKGHLHGPDGRHIVAPDAQRAAGPMLRAFTTPDRGESAEKTVEGIKFVLTIENEEMTPDPDLVAIGEARAGLIGLQTEVVRASTVAGGLHATGQVSANPNGLVTVNTRAAGRIVALNALPGASVVQGQVLATIESPELAQAQSAYQRAIAEVSQGEASIKIAQSGVVAAQTRLSVAERALARQKQLAASGAFASPALEAARRDKSAAEKGLSTAQTNVRALEVLVRTLEQGVASGVVARRELEAAKADLESARSVQEDAIRQLTISREALLREQSIADQGLRNAREVETAQAEVDLAKAGVTTSRNTLLQARADLTRIQSSLRVARDQIALLGGRPGGGNRVSVTAPITGEVASRTASNGQTISVGQEMFRILNDDVVWVLSDIFEADIARIRVGQKVEVFVDALQGNAYEGEVAFIHNEVDPESRTTKVRIVVNNQDERLKQNMFVRVRLGVGAASQLLVPTAALQTSAGTSFVFVEDAAGTYRKVVVQPGDSIGTFTVIRAGLEAGKKVVTDGSYQLAAMRSGG